MAKNRELKTRKDGVKQHYNTGTSVTSNADARASFYPRPVKTVEPIVHGAFEGAQHMFRPAPEGYQEAVVTEIEYLGFTRGGAPKFRLKADNGFTFESQDDDLTAFRSASSERPVRIAYSTSVRKGSDVRRTAVTGEAAPVAYAKPLAASGKTPAEAAELYRQGIPLEFALSL